MTRVIVTDSHGYPAWISPLLNKCRCFAVVLFDYSVFQGSKHNQTHREMNRHYSGFSCNVQVCRNPIIINSLLVIKMALQVKWKWDKWVKWCQWKFHYTVQIIIKWIDWLNERYWATAMYATFPLVVVKMNLFFKF